MKELSFDSGLVTYSLNGKCEVSFNPTDSNFVEKLYSAFEELDKKQEGYKAQIEKMPLQKSGMLKCAASLTACLATRFVMCCLAV